jgi:hypothetical protein
VPSAKLHRHFPGKEPWFATQSIGQCVVPGVSRVKNVPDQNQWAEATGIFGVKLCLHHKFAYRSMKGMGPSI